MRSRKPLVLFLEDDMVVADALTLVLDDWGAEVCHGVSLDALLAHAGARIGEARFIITDFHLGRGPDGLSSAPTLLAAAPHARVLMVSGSVNGRAHEAALQAGYDCMQKPARANDIIAWLERG
jgi:ActR/RegA family two-component response regulator